MTTDTQLAPTDTEIADLWHDSRSNRFEVISFARAVLARWGAQPTPSSAAEFALQALVAAGHVSQELVDKAMALPGAPQPAHSGEPVAKLVQAAQAFVLDPTSLQKKLYLEAQAWGPLAGTSQPVEREPLTDEQAISLCKMGPVHAPDGQVVRTPEQYRRELEDAKFAGIRKAERAHGITRPHPPPPTTSPATERGFFLEFSCQKTPRSNGLITNQFRLGTHP